jgi:hypothetical protein
MVAPVEGNEYWVLRNGKRETNSRFSFLFTQKPVNYLLVVMVVAAGVG